MLDKKTLGKRVKEARQWTGLNQEEFGKKIGISKQALSCIERGVHWPGIDTLEAVALESGITLNDFSEHFTNNKEIWKRQAKFNEITNRERKLVNRFRLLREDQRKALEVLLHIQDNKEK